MYRLVSTISGVEYPLDRIDEFSDTGESLDVSLPGLKGAGIKTGKHIWQRFADFLPFDRMEEDLSLGEGNTPLMAAGSRLQKFTGVSNLLLKNEFQNPTASFKDRGSLTCMFLNQFLNEKIVATISTGNMGHSIAAYGAKAGIHALVFIPSFTRPEKITAMKAHGATVVKVNAPDYSLMKKEILNLGKEYSLRIVSGNGPLRVEGYKLTAFEMYEQMHSQVPDYIAVPTSACGHIRGLFKGYRELQQAGLVDRLPRMIVVQAKNNSPIVSAIQQGKPQPIPFSGMHTIAEAISTGNPQGGDEIIDKAQKYEWLAQDVTEAQIQISQRELARSGHFVEPASATSLYAVKKLVEAGKIKSSETVILMLTGSGLKSLDAYQHDDETVIDSSLDTIGTDLSAIINNLAKY